ncbi:protein FAM117B-like [Anneissia japonica]|uniref:protein FAM117B-like n=1 Tax=Anneissia japonica TaxID=1529436 RepID=UPI00142581C5|nr:protein FAM117B-like [Anneissia japonica]
MSSQGPQRPRRTSPSCATKPQPMRATLPFTLRQGGSPTRSNSSSISNGKRGSPIPSPTQPWESHRVKSRRSPDHRTSPERSPSSPCFRVEKPKPMRATPPPSIRRTSSLDTIATYLGGHWPRESYQPNQKHQSTQTEDTLEKKGSHKRSSSWGSAELKEKLKQQRRKGSRNSPSSNSRASPVPANHSAGHSSSSQSQSRSIAIPVPRSQGVRIRGSSSVEGLNQEIEKLVLNGVEDDIGKPQVPTPDGHRAPFPGIRGKKMCDSDTQTHNYSNEESSDGSRSASRSHSESPPFQLDGSQPSSRASSSGPVEQKNEKGDSSPDLHSGNKYASSPGVNKSYLLTREPPEGCEKVLKTFSDPIHPMFEGDENNGLCPDKTKVYFCPKGLGLSAFCPLPNLPGEFTTKTLVQNNNIAVDDQK